MKANHELLGKRFRLSEAVLYVSSTGPGVDDVMRLHGATGQRYDLPASLVWRLIWEGILEEV